PIRVDQSCKQSSDQGIAQPFHIQTGEDECQDVMQNLDEVVSGVDGEKTIGEIVEGVESPGLAFCNQGDAMSDVGIPEWKFSRLQSFSKERLLRKEIGVKVTADQASSRPETVPEDPG